MVVFRAVNISANLIRVAKLLTNRMFLYPRFKGYWKLWKNSLVNGLLKFAWKCTFSEFIGQVFHGSVVPTILFN